MNPSERLSSVQRINQLAAKLSCQKTYEFLPKRVINDSVVLIGKTGSGKSTLLNLIAGEELIGKKEKGSIIIDVCNGRKPVSQIGHGGNSRTQVPKYWQDQKQECVYFDCPGFFDNKGEENEIINAFYIRSVIKKSQRTKIILVIDDSLTGARKNELIEISKGLSDMVGGQVNNLFGKVLLLVTKVSTDDDLDDVKERLQNLLQSNKTEEYKSITLFFQQIIKNQLLICFHKQKGAVKSDQICEEIMSKLKKIDYFQSDTYPVVSNGAKLYVRDCLEIAKEDSLNNLRYFSQNVFKYYNSKLKDLKQQGDVKAIKAIKQIYQKMSTLANQSKVLIPIGALHYFSTEFCHTIRNNDIFITKESLNILNNNLFTVNSADFYKDLLISDPKSFSFLFGQLNVSDVLHSVFMNPIKNTAYQFIKQLESKARHEARQRQMERLKIEQQNKQIQLKKRLKIQQQNKQQEIKRLKKQQQDTLKRQKIEQQDRQRQYQQQIEEQKKITRHNQENEEKRIKEVKECSKMIQQLKERIQNKNIQITNAKSNTTGFGVGSIGAGLGTALVVASGPVGWLAWAVGSVAAVFTGGAVYNNSKKNSLQQQLEQLRKQLYAEEKKLE